MQRKRKLVGVALGSGGKASSESKKTNRPVSIGRFLYD
jgi:hypothetical protein